MLKIGDAIELSSSDLVGHLNCRFLTNLDLSVADGELSKPSSWSNKGKEQPGTLADILIIAPYNAQVFELQKRLPGARVGTVDKFQGQEAPIAIYSLTRSTQADAPRGMEFLYSLNRLIVATS